MSTTTHDGRITLDDVISFHVPSFLTADYDPTYRPSAINHYDDINNTDVDQADRDALRANTKPCKACGGPLTAGQYSIHETCKETGLAGLTCICPPNCTDTHWGDNGTCPADCKPCSIMAGIAYVKPT